MVDIGRNDPCPCGSGKKYKHCCFRASPPAIGPEESAEKWLVQELLAFCRRRYKSELDRAAEEFWQGFVPRDHLAEKDLDMPEQNFWEWIVFDWLPDENDGKGLIGLYREGNQRLTGEENRVLDMMKQSPLSLFEVQEVFPERGLLVEDVLQGGKYNVRERLATRQLLKWDIFAGRLLRLDGAFVLSGAVYPYNIRQKGPIVAAVNKGWRAFKNDFPKASKRDYLKLDGTQFNY